MIFTLFLCFMGSVFLSFFVLAPLLSRQCRTELSRSKEGFADEDELRKVTELRDALLQKLVYGKSNLPEVDNRNDEDVFKGFVSVCARLQKANLPWQPKQLNAPVVNLNSGQSGKTRLSFALFFMSLQLFALVLFSISAHAQTALNSNLPVSIDKLIPQATKLNTQNDFLPSVNQFVLLPMLGKLHVYYVGMFYNSGKGGQKIKMHLPFPKGVENLQLSSALDLMVDKSSQYGSPVVNFSLKNGLNQLSAEFTIPATFGTVFWKSNDLKNLPGVTLFMMPEYFGPLRNLLANIYGDFDFWPARVKDMSKDFRSFIGNNEMQNSMHKFEHSQTRQFIRIGNKDSLYPTFQVNGIVPERILLVVMILFFACFLFGLSVFFIIKTSK